MSVSENIRKAKGQLRETFRMTTTRPVAILMIVIGVFVFGWQSYDKLPLNLMPEISYPSLTVRTEYPGAAPEEVENNVAKRIESALAVVDSLTNISSISKAGLCDVILEFKWNTDMNAATADVREKLDQVFLPPEVERPLILRYDPSLDPIVRVAFFSTKNEFGLSDDEMATQLREYAENELREKLESVEGVAAVRVRGGLERELLIEMDENALRAKRIDPQDVIAKVRDGNINVAGGNLREGETEFQVRVLNEYQDLETIRNLIIDRRGGAEIRLGEVATVRWHHKDREIYTRVDGEPSVEINIFKEADANIVSVAQKVRERIFGTPQEQALAQRLREAREKAERGEAPPQGQQQGGRGGRGPGGPGGGGAQEPTFLANEVYNRNWGFDVLTDQSIFIRDSINEVRDNAVQGGILSIIILFLFLREVKSTVLIGLTIPISVVATFAPMMTFGVSLNIMSLGGLALGVGMLVDNAIVVLESIFRCREEGDGLIEAVIRGTGEVGGAVVASTLTTVAVFFPIVFVEGVAGQIFGDMALTIVFSLIASLMAALFFIPMLASRQLPDVAVTGSVFGNVLHFNSIAWIRDRLSGFWKKERKLPGRILMVFTTIPYHLYLLIVFLIYLAAELIGKLFGIALRLVFLVARLLMNTVGVAIGYVLKPILWAFGKFIDLLNAGYPVLIRWALNNKIIVIALAVILAYHAFTLVTGLKAELIPEIHQGEFNVRIKAPVGTDIEKTNQLTGQVEERIMADLSSGDGEQKVTLFETLATVVGAEKSSNTRSDEGENTAVVTVRLKPAEEIKEAELAAIDAVRAGVSQIPGITSITFDRPVLFSFKTPIEVEIKGQDREFLKAYSEEAVRAMAAIPGVIDVKNSIQPGNPELQILFDRDKLRLYNLDIAVVAQKVRDLVEGNIPTEYRRADRQYDIRIRLQRSDIETQRDLENLIVSPSGSTIIRLSDVAAIITREGPNEIRRIGQERTALISANIEDIDLKTATTRIRAALSDLRVAWQPDYRFDITGQTEEMDVSTNSLQWAALLAVFLVYIVMASQFESMLQPFIILFTIPMALVGVVYQLVLSGTPVSVVVLIGVIMLAGIVVNNAIVLVDYVNQLRHRGLEKRQALIEAGKARLRPILMTTMTTVLGLMPLALGMGAGAEIRSPMAWTVIAGLATSTLLTLVVIPCIYELIDRRKFAAEQTEVAVQAPPEGLE